MLVWTAFVSCNVNTMFICSYMFTYRPYVRVNSICVLQYKHYVHMVWCFSMSYRMTSSRVRVNNNCVFQWKQVVHMVNIYEHRLQEMHRYEHFQNQGSLCMCTDMNIDCKRLSFSLFWYYFTIRFSMYLGRNENLVHLDNKFQYM